MTNAPEALLFLDCDSLTRLPDGPEELERALRRLIYTATWVKWHRRAKDVEALTERYHFSRREILERHFVVTQADAIYRHLMLTGRFPHLDVLGSVALTFARTFASLYDQLPTEGKRKLRGAVWSALDSDRGLGPLIWEFTMMTAICGNGARVSPIDLTDRGRFDFLCQTSDEELEVECKQVTWMKGLGDDGRAFDLLCRALEDRYLDRIPRSNDVLLLTIDTDQPLPKAPSQVAQIAEAVVEAASSGLTISRNSWRIRSSPILEWDGSRERDHLRRTYELASDLARDKQFTEMTFFGSGQSPLVLGTLRPKPDRDVPLRIWERFLRRACRQFSGSLPAALFVEIERSPRLYSHGKHQERALELRAGYLALILEALESVGRTRDHLLAVHVCFGGPPFSGGDCHNLANPNSRVPVSPLLERLGETNRAPDSQTAWRDQWDDQWLGR